jgi:ribosomal protein L37AE/L43A
VNLEQHPGVICVEKAKQAKTQPELKSRRVKFCPKCGSTDVSWASGLAQLWSIWECRNCGYRGAFILEDGKLSHILREEYARKAAARFDGRHD